MSNLLVDQSIPVDLYQKVISIQGNTANVKSSNSEDRFWLSNGRKMNDSNWEVLNIKFKSPASISLIAFEMLAVGSQFELWFTNRTGQRLPVLDQSLRQYTGKISSSPVENQWINFTKHIYPIVASAVEIRIQRVNDQVFPLDASISVGLRNTYFKRNIYSREDTNITLDAGVDAMGNSIQRTIKDWDASKAVDDALATFWKCEPQPDPNAVVCFYLDARSETGNSQRVDRLWLDPVYTGQAMNFYYSNDETIGVRKLSKIRLPPLDSSVDWTFDEFGLNLTETTASYDIDSIALGQFNMSDPGLVFLGTWVPNFNSASSPGSNLTILRNETQVVSTNDFKLIFNVSLKKLQYTSGGQTVSSGVLSFTAGSAISFAAISGVNNSLLVNQAGNYTSQTTNTSTTTHTDRWGTKIQLQYNSGWIKEFAVRQGFDQDLIDSYMANPTVFLTPDPVIANNSGVVPSTTLDNLVYGADFTTKEHGFGGLDSNFFTEKIWSPMFKDWTTYRGFYYFPAPIMAKFVKLEFTELVAESYPIYETGIDVKYQSFPIDVIKTSKSLLTEKATSTTVSSTVNSSVNGVVGGGTNTTKTYNAGVVNYAPDTQVTVGKGVFDDLPRSFDTPVSNSIAKEVTSSSFSSNQTSTSRAVNFIENVSYVQKQVTSNVQVAKDAYYTVVKGDWLIKIAARYGIDWHTIYNLNKDLIDNDRRVSKLPSRPDGWWIFPGQQLRIPGVIMENMTQTSTVTERIVSTTQDVITTSTNTNINTNTTSTLTTARARFTTTQIHRYEIKTATRDVAIAYFTGLREVRLFTVNYIAAEDTVDYTIVGSDFEVMTDVVDNFVKQSDDSWKPETPTAVCTITSNDSWLSTSPFIKMKINTITNPLYREISGINTLSAISLDAEESAFWSTDIVTWSSTTAFWGAARPLGSADVDANVYFDGENAMRIYRGATSSPTDIGVKSPVFQFPNHLGWTRITIIYNTNLNRNIPGSNTYRLEIVDPTDEINPLFSEEVPPGPVGKWNTFTTHFFAPADNRDVYVRFVTTGEQTETLHIGNIFTQTSSTTIQISNDGGANYYDATPAVNNPDGYFVFPNPGNSFKWKVNSFGPRERIYGINFTPYYLV